MNSLKKGSFLLTLGRKEGFIDGSGSRALFIEFPPPSKKLRSGNQIHSWIRSVCYWFRMGHLLIVENMSMEPSKYTILVVDDEELLRNLIVTFLSKLGHSCVTAIDGVDALDKMEGNKIDAVVTDIKMPHMDGITLTSKISIRYPELAIMIMTAFEEEDTAGLAVCAGARDFIRKPFSLNEFSVRLHKMINDSEAQRRMKREKDVDKTIQEFTNELEPPKQMKRERAIDDGMRELLDELQASLKKT